MLKCEFYSSAEKLSRRPQAAPSLIGMTLEAFDNLYDEFAVAHAQRLANLTVTKRKGTPRQRAVGAGGSRGRVKPCPYSLRDRLLMTLFWLRVYTTYEVMGFFYELNKTNIEDNIKDILATLDTMTSFTYDRPGPGRKKLRSAGEVMDAFPDVRLVIDSKEQRIERPTAWYLQVSQEEPKWNEMKTIKPSIGDEVHNSDELPG